MNKIHWMELELKQILLGNWSENWLSYFQF